MAEIVKSKGSGPKGPVRPLRPRPKLAGFPLMAALAWLLLANPARAQSVLLGPIARRVKAKIELDPRLPSGVLRRDVLALNPPHDLACSLTLPVCVANAPAVAYRGNEVRSKPLLRGAAAMEGHLAAALSALEIGYRRLVYAARLPEPERRWDPNSGSPAVTWELRPTPGPLTVDLVPAQNRAFDSASVVCRSGVADVALAAANYEREAAFCIGEAIAARLDPAESPRSRRAYAAGLWWEVGQPNGSDLVEVVRANAEAHQAAVGRDELDAAASTALFFEYIEQTLGTEVPYGLVTGLFALSGRTQRADGPRTLNEPDWLDVLRGSLSDDRVDFAHRVNAFAAARAQLGSSAGPLGRLAWAGTFARIVPDWNLRVSSLPRRVANKMPIGPLGMVAVRIDIDVPTNDLSLAVHVEWEGPGPFSWTAVKLDAQEQETGRLDFAFEPRVTNAEKRIVALDGVRSLLILGVNLGGIDATHLLDPDHAPFEPHGCTVYVVRI